MIDAYIKIGIKLKALRIALDATQGKIGKIVGCTSANISLWEKGYGKPPITDLNKIADHYGLPRSFFFEDHDREYATYSDSTNFDKYGCYLESLSNVSKLLLESKKRKSR